MSYIDTKKEALSWYNKHRLSFKFMMLLKPKIDNDLLKNDLFIPALLTVFLERNLKKETKYLIDHYVPPSLKNEIGDIYRLDDYYFNQKVLNYLNSHKIFRIPCGSFETNQWQSTTTTLYTYTEAIRSLELEPFEYEYHRDTHSSTHRTTITNKIYIAQYASDALQVNIYSNRVAIDQTQNGYSKQGNSGANYFDINYGTPNPIAAKTDGAFKYIFDNPESSKVIDFLYQTKGIWPIIKDSMLNNSKSIQLFNKLDEESKYKMLFMTSDLDSESSVKAFFLLNDVNQFENWQALLTSVNKITSTELVSSVELPTIDLF